MFISNVDIEGEPLEVREYVIGDIMHIVLV